jgi:hypothetical protein
VSDLPGGFHLPYEDVPDGPIESTVAAGAVLVDQVTVRSAWVDAFPFGPLPTLIFDFANSASGPLPPLVLVGSVEGLLNLAEVVSSGARAAVREYNRKFKDGAGGG